ncbi:MAG TPA: hypothetical protein VJW76_06425, partial [Verrucomicrobiae bacterium]|nr:hypothetical protein [Verrucomicrobiae bacterium]
GCQHQAKRENEGTQQTKTMESIYSHGTFPLTLTLSPGEREQQFTRCDVLNISGFVSCIGFSREKGRRESECVRLRRERWTILPLPKGEGWGEGELKALFAGTHGVTSTSLVGMT